MKETDIKKSSFRSSFKGLLPLFILAHFAHHLVNALPVPMLPMIRSEFSLDYTRSGFVISAFQLSYGIAQVPSGWIADRIGASLVMTIGICGVAAAGIFIGLSQTYIMLLIFMILMGLLGGGYHPASPPAISKMVEPRNLGRALGLHMIGGSASHFLSPLLAASIATIWGWRGPFIALAIPTVIFGVVFYLILRRQEAANKAEPPTIAASSSGARFKSRLRHLVTFFVLLNFTHAVFFSIISFVPLYLVDTLGISKETAAASMSLIYSSGLWAAPLGGYFSDRWGRIPVILTACFLIGPAVYMLNVASHGLGIAVLLVVFGMLLYSHNPVSQAYIVDHTSERNRATLLGLYFFGNIEGGGLLTPLMGYSIDQIGFHDSFIIAAIALLTVTIICSLLLRGSKG
ncbi:MFS transporter [Chloroflexota bacterium]